MDPNTDILARATVLAWSAEIGGATVAVPVEALSAPGAETFDSFGFDEGLGEDGLGYLAMRDGRRLVLPDISPDAAREAAECGVVVVYEFDAATLGTRQYPVDVVPSAPAPGM